MTEETIRNKVAESGLICFDPAHLIDFSSIRTFDFKPFLIEESLLREKEFRQQMSLHDWDKYRDKYVAVYCSVEAIIPAWAYMLVASALQPYARMVMAGTEKQLKEWLFRQAIEQLNVEEYRHQRVTIKGCSDVPLSAYIDLVMKLQPVVASLMYGEPCSTVPVFKKKK